MEHSQELRGAVERLAKLSTRSTTEEFLCCVYPIEDEDMYRGGMQVVREVSLNVLVPVQCDPRDCRATVFSIKSMHWIGEHVHRRP
jgi:hypothetical protein